MLRPINLIGITLLIILTLTSAVFSQTQTEQLIITTYYPSPYGSYRDLYVSNNVGIGTVSPVVKLHISDSSPSGVRILMSDLAQGANLKIWVIQNAVQKILFSTYNDDYSGIASHLVIQRDGNVGIGTTNPPSRLAVVGLSSGGGNTLRIVPGTGEISYEASSKKYKKNIRSFKDDFYKILRAKPKSFEFKDTGGKDIGYIAEDFDELGLKSLLIYRDGQPDTVKYDRIALYILEIVKDQQNKIKELEERIKILEAQKTEMKKGRFK